jgi:DNA uptake protein ComE-like DNA-binding protein
VAQIYRERGEAGLRELPGVGKSLAGLIAAWLQEEQTSAS